MSFSDKHTFLGSHNDSENTLSAPSDEELSNSENISSGCSKQNISMCVRDKRIPEPVENLTTKNDNVNVEKKPGSNLMCAMCNKIFKEQRYLKQHMRRQHSQFDDSKSLHKCPECKDNISKRSMEQHLKVHGIELTTEDLEFNSLEEFELWKESVEKSSKTRFRQLWSHNASDKKYMNFICHRSGDFISKSKGLRHLKLKGSNKINCYCPASISAHFSADGSCHIRYCSTHLGHQNDIAYLSLTSTEREVIASKIAANIPFDAILDNIQSSRTEKDLCRLHLLTKKDLHNIVTSFNLHSDAVKMKNDITRVDVGVRSRNMKNDCTSFYEAQDDAIETESMINTIDTVYPEASTSMKESLESLKEQYIQLISSVTSFEEIDILKENLLSLKASLQAANTSSFVSIQATTNILANENMIPKQCLKPRLRRKPKNNQMFKKKAARKECQEAVLTLMLNNKG